MIIARLLAGRSTVAKLWIGILAFAVLLTLLAIAGLWRLGNVKERDERIPAVVNIDHEQRATNLQNTLKSDKLSAVERAVHLRNLGGEYQAQGKHSEAVTAYKQAIEAAKYPEYGLYQELAIAHEAAGQKSEAIAAYKKALDEASDPADSKADPAPEFVIEDLQAKIKDLSK